MICTENVYKHLSRSYVIRRDIVQMGCVMVVLSVHVVYYTCRSLIIVMNCILLSTLVDYVLIESVTFCKLNVKHTATHNFEFDFVACHVIRSMYSTWAPKESSTNHDLVLSHSFVRQL
jgi:hypothetical protein